jgi:hypothetical protein
MPGYSVKNIMSTLNKEQREYAERAESVAAEFNVSGIQAGGLSPICFFSSQILSYRQWGLQRWAEASYRGDGE